MIAVGIGTVDKGLAFCEETNFPKDNLYVDSEKQTYDAVGFYQGAERTFFRPEIPAAIAKRGVADLMPILPRYLNAWRRDGKKWLPPKFDVGVSAGLEQGFQQGGTFVFQGRSVIFEHFDAGTGVHADVKELLAAVTQTEDLQ